MSKTVSIKRTAASSLVLCVTLALSAPPARPHRFELDVNLLTGYTDNVDLSKDKQGDIPFELAASFKYEEQSARTRGLVDGGIGYRWYLQGNGSDEIRPNVHANVHWNLDPDRWTWTLDGALTQVRIDQLGPDAPANLETQGVIWTGPDFRAQLSSVTAVIIEGRAGYQYNSETKDDNYRLGGTVRLKTKRSETSSLSLH